MAQSNELRVFISSTFRDLQEEREHLVKKIFPEIRALCRERGITFTEVDLRWGLTEEDVVLGQVIRTCLEEIDRCRPYFIGITGERYGYVPELHEYYKDPELLQRWPWIEEAAMDDSSIIDLEFRHAVLNDPVTGNGRARFFFRRQRRQLDESRGESEEELQLDGLKHRIRDAGLAVEEYRDPASLGELVYDVLIEIIRRDFADAKPPTPLEEERSRHRAFAASRVRAYIPNPEYLKRLNDWFAGEEQPLVLYAESGSGKSSLVAFWCDQLRRRNPDLFIIEHYVGIGAGDSDHLGIIRHIMEEIRERFDRSEELPSKPDELERSFANWLGFNAGSPMLVVIDGINQLSGRALDMHWLPQVMPDGVKLIISSTVEQTLVDLRRRGWSELGMQPLKEHEREAVVVRFLAEYHKALSSEQVRQIAEDMKCSHPLFLRTLLEELRLHGTHEHLDHALKSLLETTGTEDLFQRVLERLEEDYNLRAVREVMTLVWASKSGLSEEELAEMAGISRLKLSTLLLGLDYHLVRRDGLLTFFHDYLRRAVGKRYVSNEQKKRQAHEQLAVYFERADATLRTTRELLHALELLGERGRLEQVLSAINRFDQLWPSERNEVLRLWSATEPPAVASAYRATLQQWQVTVGEQERGVMLGKVARLLQIVGAWQEAQVLQEERLLLASQREDRAEEAAARNGLGGLLQLRGEEKAFEELVRARDLYTELGDRNGLAGAIGKLGVFYLNRTAFDEALECFRQQEAIYRELGDRMGLSLALGDMGIVYTDFGEYEQALECHRQSETIARDLGDRMGMSAAIGNMGLVYSNLGEYDLALKCFRQAETIGRDLGDRRVLACNVNNIGLVYAMQGQYSEAMNLYEEALEINRRMGNRQWMSINLGLIGNVYVQRGEYVEALECFRQKETISRDLGDRIGISVAIASMGLVYDNCGEYDEALECYRQSETVFRELGVRSSWPIALGNIGNVLARRGEYEEALACFREASEEHRAIGLRDMLCLWLQKTADVLVELVEAGGEEMPEYLPKYVPDAEQGGWRTMSLQMAREQAEECVAISEELPKPDTYFGGRVSLAKIRAAEGDIRGATATLQTMLSESSDDDERAELYYRLWKLNVADMDHRAEAVRLYQMLIEKTPKHDYRMRIDELTTTGTMRASDATE